MIAGAASNPMTRDDLTAEQRSAVGEAWIQMGLGEHASIAAFGRLVLDLIAAGAPPELLTGAASALKDEIRHAQLCFGIARQFNGRPASPGRLVLEDAPAPVGDPAALLEGVIFEGCFAE